MSRDLVDSTELPTGIPTIRYVPSEHVAHGTSPSRHVLNLLMGCPAEFLPLEKQPFEDHDMEADFDDDVVVTSLDQLKLASFTSGTQRQDSGKLMASDGPAVHRWPSSLTPRTPTRVFAQSKCSICSTSYVVNRSNVFVL